MTRQTRVSPAAQRRATPQGTVWLIEISRWTSGPTVTPRTTPGVPSLGAQPLDFLTIQLYMFREKMRAVEPMSSMLKGMKDDELKRLAASIAKSPPPAPNAEPADAARIERARALVAQHRCNFCHNKDYSGQQNVPRLAGQREDYLLKALRDYKSNARRGYDAIMDDVLYPLNDDNFQDLAHFLSRQR